MILRQSVLRLGSLTILCVLGSPVVAQSQTAPASQTVPAPVSQASAKMTLADVLTEARKNYPAIRAAQAQQRAAQSSIGVARTAYLPRTDFLWQTNRATANNIYGLLLPQAVVPTISGPVIGSDFSRSAWSSAGGALFSWQPFDFGARAAKVSAAREGSQAAEQAEVLAELQTEAAAAGAFFDLAAAQQLAVVAQANVSRNETFNRAVHVLVDNTLRPGADASQADAQLALARNQLIQAQTQVAVRRSALAKFLQRAADAIQIDDAPVLNSTPATDITMIDATKHPAVLEEDALVRQQQAQQRALDRSYVPQFSTLAALSGRGAGTDLNGNFPGGTAGLAPNTPNWAAGIQINFAAMDFFSLREQAKVQRANTQAEQARRSQALLEVSSAVEQARAILSGTRATAANTPAEVTAARASEQQQQARYRSGLATVVDVAAAESALAQAETDDAIARLSVWRAEVGLAASQGTFEPLLNVNGSSGETK